MFRSEAQGFNPTALETQNNPFPNKPFANYYLNIAKSLRYFRELESIIRRVNKRYALSRQYEYSGHLKRHDGKVAVVTGGERGIGKEVALYLTKNGFKVYIGVRDVTKADEVIEKVKRENSLYQLRAQRLELSSLESVRSFAKTVAEKEPKIDLLINCANDFEKKRIVTREGFEKNFAANYLGHYLLTSILVNNLKKSENGRIVNISSIAHHFGRIDFEDINSTKMFRPFLAYAQSQLAQVLFTRELAKKIRDSNVTVYSVGPEVFRNENFEIPKNYILGQLMNRMSDPEYGSQTILYVALEDKLKNESGYYYHDLKRVDVMPDHTIDDTTAEKLWELSEDMVKNEPKFKLISDRNIP